MRYYQKGSENVIDAKPITKEEGRNLLARSFVYMFVGLLITGAIALGLGYLFFNLIQQDPNYKNVVLGITIGCGIGLIVMTFVNSLVLLKNKHSLIVPSLIYVALMGAMLSSFVSLGIDWKILGTAFVIASAAFGIMALIGILSKGRLTMLAIVGSGLLFGAGLLALVFLITSLITRTAFATTYFMIDMMIFAAMMLFTIFDINNISKISQQGEYSENLALYCALTLYTDFIYIFVKIVYYLLIISRR